MPANLSPEFKEAQEAHRRARDPQERLDCLREMLRTIPKHKGTEHLQADIKTRIKELTEELSGPKRGGARGPAVTVHPEGAGQIALLGPPNCGKSALHARLTGSHAVVAPYPFATKLPLPGMLPHEDIQLQLVDLPPVAADSVEPWMANAVQNADGALLLLDLAEPDCVEMLEALRRRLAERHVILVVPGAAAAAASSDEEALAETFHIRLPTALLASKSDRLANPAVELAAFRDLAGVGFPPLAISAETGEGLGEIGPLLFAMLGIARVYSKLPGHPPDRSRPFTLRPGGTVRDVARMVHRGLAAELKFARLWGSARFDGEHVSGDHPLHDRDVVELHF
jgi:ribosome-interacting GTPase 1